MGYTELIAAQQNCTNKTTSNGFSSNDSLDNCGVVQEELFAIILRFQKHKIANIFVPYTKNISTNLGKSCSNLTVYILEKCVNGRK